MIKFAVRQNSSRSLDVLGEDNDPLLGLNDSTAALRQMTLGAPSF
jgi:hypothetical protein